MKWTATTTTVTALVFLGASALITWWLRPSTPAPAAAAIPLPPSVRVETVETTRIVPKYITVYRDRAKAETGLPAQVQADPAKHVTATGHLNADARPYTLTAVLDAETGASAVYASPEPLPWFALRPRTAIGVAMAIREDGSQVGLLHGRADLIQIKAVHAGALAQIDTDGRALAGINLEWRF